MEPSSSQDIRMAGFRARTPVSRVLPWLDKTVQRLGSEIVALPQASGRVLAEPVTSSVAVPGFQRAMMDGFAVRAEDVQGASEYQPLELQVVGEAWPGTPAHVAVAPGTAVQVMTGAPLPDGADTVIPVEWVERRGNRVDIAQGLPRGKHVGQVGEDVAAQSMVLPEGRRLRPQDLGVLSSIGQDRVAVVRQPRVRLCITGNELLPAGTPPRDYQITDANSPMLQALVERDGGIALFPGITPDDPEAIEAVLREAVDVVLVSGGSSVGQEDWAPSLVRKLGELPFHGLAMRPSSPAGIGRIAEKWVFLLPGNPVSCLCAYDFFAGRCIRLLGGRSATWPYRSRTARLTKNLTSKLGRRDYCRVRNTQDGVEPLAISGASMLSSTTRADGFVIVPDDLEGLESGTLVEVFDYEPT